MEWRNPVKSVGICFRKTGQLTQHFLMADDVGATHLLVNFLVEADAFIVALENFSEDEAGFLRAAAGPDGRSLFAPPDCYGRREPWRYSVCPINCGSKLKL
jgi:hypothetical protein